VTWEQFVGALLGLALVAVARLLDRYLPPTEGHPVAAAVAPTAPAVPSLSDLTVIEPDTPETPPEAPPAAPQAPTAPPDEDTGPSPPS